jgi:hypothetical protein
MRRQSRKATVIWSEAQSKDLQLPFGFCPDKSARFMMMAMNLDFGFERLDQVLFGRFSASLPGENAFGESAKHAAPPHNYSGSRFQHRCRFACTERDATSFV